MAASFINPGKPGDAVNVNAALAPPSSSSAASAPSQPKQIRFVNNQGQPPSKRRRINAACLTCRRRKTRCAGERPACSTCTKNGHQCQGYPEEKKDGSDGIEGEAEAKAEGSDEERDQDRSRGDVRGDRGEEGRKDDRSTKKEPKIPKTHQAAVDCGPSGGVPPRKPGVSHQQPPARSTGRSEPTPVAHAGGGQKKVAEPISPALTRGAHATADTDASPRVPRAATVGSQLSYPDDPDSPSMRRSAAANSHRVPYFRFFGPTAIVPGFKQMVVSVKDRRRSTNGSHPATSPMSNPSGVVNSIAVESDIAVEEPPIYDPNDPEPVHPLIISLVKTFFVHLGCNYPFLKQQKFMTLVKEKRAEPILVDAVCALAARFSDSPILTGGNDKMPRTDRGQGFAARAKQATVDTFPCPTVPAVQACLLMAYEGFGANQDSALWMYLGVAIRMAVDLGLQKRVGILYQGDSDPYNIQRARRAGESASPEETKARPDTPSHEEQKELEQERIDTFWAVFFLDRAISSGTGRPVTIRDDDFELSVPEPALHPEARWPNPFPILIEIVHLYGRVSDVLNNVHDISDLTQEKWQKLMSFEHQLTKVYKSWDSRLQFNVLNFKAYLGIGQGTTFILLHFWFHALFIILHQPTILSPFGELRSELQLLPDSRELSMSSAKTICDILAFADLIDPKSFIGNPFTSQPMYIAACAFLMESSASASEVPSRETTPPKQPQKASKETSKKSRHSILASAANQSYQQCYSSLQNLHDYWGGVKYILTALDQKAKGIWDVETFTTEEYESTKSRPEGLGSHLGLDNVTSSPKMGGPPIGWTLAGTANSPNSSLTLMYQNPSTTKTAGGPPQVMPRLAGTPPSGKMLDETARSGAAGSGMFPRSSSIIQPNTSAIRPSPRRQMSSLSNSGVGVMNLEDVAEESSEPGGMMLAPNAANFTSPSQHSGGGGSGGFENYSNSPTTNLADNTLGGVGAHNMYYQPNMTYPSVWGSGSASMDGIMFDSQDIDIGALGLQQPDLMGSSWLDYIPGDVLGLFDHQDMGHGSQQSGP